MFSFSDEIKITNKIGFAMQQINSNSSIQIDKPSNYYIIQKNEGENVHVSRLLKVGKLSDPARNVQRLGTDGRTARWDVEQHWEERGTVSRLRGASASWT